jgi:putative transposase
VKTVPTLHVVSKTAAPAEIDGLGMTDLPAEVQVALTDIAGAARDGLLAMSVAAGMAVLQAMLDAEITAACGPKGRHDPDRAAVRHGTGRGSVVLGGRRVPVTRPRARTVDGHEVPLAAYRQFAADDLLSRVVLERMLAGVATRRHAGRVSRSAPTCSRRRPRRAARRSRGGSWPRPGPRWPSCWPGICPVWTSRC